MKKALMPTIIFISGPIIGFCLTWLLCIGSKPGDACLDSGILVVPLCTIFSIILSVVLVLRSAQMCHTEGFQYKSISIASAFGILFYGVLIAIVIEYLFFHIALFFHTTPGDPFSVVTMLSYCIFPFTVFSVYYILVDRKISKSEV